MVFPRPEGADRSGAGGFSAPRGRGFVRRWWFFRAQKAQIGQVLVVFPRSEGADPSGADGSSAPRAKMIPSVEAGTFHVFSQMRWGKSLCFAPHRLEPMFIQFSEVAVEIRGWWALGFFTLLRCGWYSESITVLQPSYSFLSIFIVF